MGEPGLDTLSTSRRLAGLIGPTVVVLSLSETMNFGIWADNIPPVTYLNGSLLFVAGLSIVRTHNRWSAGWPVMVTLAGWVGIMGGLFRMFAPEARQASPSTATFAAMAALCAVGLVLTLKAYGRGSGHAGQP